MVDETLSLRVVGIPKPQARPRAYRRGNFSGVYSPKTDWFSLVHGHAMEMRPRTPLSGALLLSVQFFMPRPKSTKKDVIWHTKRPDVDNCVKAIMDSLSNARWWEDDARIATLVASKSYETLLEPAGVKIEVRQLT